MGPDGPLWTTEHDVHFVDETHDAIIPPHVTEAAREIIVKTRTTTQSQIITPLSVTIRIHVEDDELVMHAQVHPKDATQQKPEIVDHQIAQISDDTEQAGGRFTLTHTEQGDAVAIWRVPLSSDQARSPS